MTAPRAFCSVVVPTRDRPDALRACLEGLARLDYPHDRMEVIVVDDGGQVDLESVVTPVRAVLDVTLLHQHWAGPAAARNRGAERARGEVLAFTDDDCAPRPDWLARLAARCAENPGSASGGLTVNAVAGNLYSDAAQTIIDAGYAQCNHDASPFPFFTTNNLAVPADGFRSTGGFDASFITAEDRDFCARWAARGWKIVYEPGAVVEHRHRLSFWKFCRLYFSYGRGAFRFRHRQALRGRRVPVQPSFYLRTLPRFAVAGRGLRKAAGMLALLGLWHLANTSGYVYERARGAGRPTRATVPERQASRPAE